MFSKDCDLRLRLHWVSRKIQGVSQRFLFSSIYFPVFVYINNISAWVSEVKSSLVTQLFQCRILTNGGRFKKYNDIRMYYPQFWHVAHHGAMGKLWVFCYLSMDWFSLTRCPSKRAWITTEILKAIVVYGLARHAKYIWIIQFSSQSFCSGTHQRKSYCNLILSSLSYVLFLSRQICPNTEAHTLLFCAEAFEKGVLFGPRFRPYTPENKTNERWINSEVSNCS